MTQYGHIAARGRGIFIDRWGAGPHILIAGGKTFYFEDSSRFGPVPLDVKGEPSNDLFHFPEGSPFWSVWQRWVDEGRQVTEGKKKGWLYCIVSNGRRRKGAAP